MIRLNPIPNARFNASALSALAAVGLMLISAPARADHVESAFAHHVGRVAASHFLLAGELFFGAPVAVPVPVVVHREVVYRAPVVYPVVYEQPYYPVVRHVHYDGCGHGGWAHHGRGHRKHGKHGKHGRGHDRWDGHRGRY